MPPSLVASRRHRRTKVGRVTPDQGWDDVVPQGPADRSGWGVIVVLVVVVAVGLLARSPATQPARVRPTPASSPRSLQVVENPAIPQPDVDQVGARVDLGGTWSSAGRPPRPLGLTSSHATWTGDDLVVGFSPGVAAYRPGSGPQAGWRPLPPHPGGAVQIRGAVQRQGAAIFVYGARQCADCDWEPSLYSFNPISEVWRQHAAAPGPVGAGQVAVSMVGTQPVVVRDRQPQGLEALMYDPAADDWLDLDVPATPMLRWQAITAGRELLIIGVTSDADGGEVPMAIAYNRTREAWRDVSEGLSLRAPDRVAAVWTGSAVVLFGASGRNGSPRGAMLSLNDGRWTPLPPLPVFHHLLPVVDDDRSLVGLTGVWDGARAGFFGGMGQPLFVAWSPFTGEWQVRQPPPPRTGGQASWTGRQILLWGGLSPSTVTDLQSWTATPNAPS